MWMLGIGLCLGPASNTAFSAPLGGIELTDHHGAPFRFESHRHRTILLQFGYTHCPDVCPLTLQNLRGTLSFLGDDDKAYLPVFVSVDPKRDEPDRLRDYLGYFHPRILGLTGTPDTLRRLADQCHTGYQVHDAGGDPNYPVDHSPNLFVIQPGGTLAGTIPHGISPRDSADIIRSLSVTP
jgi:protein SCO1/2